MRKSVLPGRWMFSNNSRLWPLATNRHNRRHDSMSQERKLFRIVAALAAIALPLMLPIASKEGAAQMSGVLWSADFETGDFSQLEQGGGGGVFNSGSGVASATGEVSRGQAYSARMSITTNDGANHARASSGGRSRRRIVSCTTASGTTSRSATTSRRAGGTCSSGSPRRRHGTTRSGS